MCQRLPRTEHWRQLFMPPPVTSRANSSCILAPAFFPAVPRVPRFNRQGLHQIPRAVE